MNFYLKSMLYDIVKARSEAYLVDFVYSTVGLLKITSDWFNIFDGREIIDLYFWIGLDDGLRITQIGYIDLILSFDGSEFILRYRI